VRPLGVWLGVTAVIVAVAWLLWRAPRTTPPVESPSATETDVLSRMDRVLPRDAIAPVYRPRFVSAAQARLRPTELVLGVAINGESRAYPITVLNSREMVNDVVGGVPILATW